MSRESAAPPPYQSSGSSGAPEQNPGKVWGIVGFILAFLPFLSLVGIILSIVGLVKSKRAGMSNGLAIAGIIIGTIVLIGTVIVTIGIVAFTGAALEVVEQCQNDPQGSVTVQGETVDCADLQQP